jgi:hypothetical protein
LAAGSHSITAVYSGDGNFMAVTSAALTEVVTSFAIGPPSGGSTSATVSPGGQATYTLLVTPPSTGSAVTFSLTGLPAGATATFSPTSVAAGAGPTTVTLTVTVPTTAEVQPQERPWASGPPLLAIGLLLPFAGCLRKGTRRWLWVVVLAVAGLASMSACGGGGSSGDGGGGGGGGTPQNYTLTVTATSGTLTQTTTLTLTVN